jgi:LmbE family N-acetylglucosaminyl deacetylase
MKKKDDEFAIVVAHPDDEILFASSIIKEATRIIVCFSDIPGEDTISKIQIK